MYHCAIQYMHYVFRAIQQTRSDIVVDETYHNSDFGGIFVPELRSKHSAWQSVSIVSIAAEPALLLRTKAMEEPHFQFV